MVNKYNARARHPAIAALSYAGVVRAFFFAGGGFAFRELQDCLRTSQAVVLGTLLPVLQLFAIA